MNKALLRSIMIKNGDTQTSLARAMGISLSNLNAKINEWGKAEFRQSEILFIQKHYRLSDSERNKIFFGNKVS